jgi:hypothetical protein
MLWLVAIAVWALAVKDASAHPRYVKARSAYAIYVHSNL